MSPSTLYDTGKADLVIIIIRTYGTYCVLFAIEKLNIVSFKRFMAFSERTVYYTRDFARFMLDFFILE